MSLAEIFDKDLRITPGLDGSFVVQLGERTSFADKVHGFTNVVDLMAWLQRAAQAKQAEGELLLEVADVVKTVSVKPWPIQGTVGETKRTTAYGSLADRIASTGDNPAA